MVLGESDFLNATFEVSRAAGWLALAGLYVSVGGPKTRLNFLYGRHMSEDM